MKRIVLSFALAVIMAAGIIPVFSLHASADDGLPVIRVDASAANRIPSGIDVFVSQVHGRDYTCELYLPGNADVQNCCFSWDGDMTASVDGIIYDSGSCPVPSAGSEKTYVFSEDGQARFYVSIRTYQGSEDVIPIFIDIDEDKGTIAAMDGDPDHETSCSGSIYIGGRRYEMPKIKGRGNTSWDSAEDKRAYNVTLAEKITFPGLQSDAAKKWSFLAETGDHSLLRNRVGLHLAHEMGIGQDTESADVWMNGEYQGCYTVTPKYDSFVSKNGYLIEQDNYKEAGVADGGDPQFMLEGMRSNGLICNLITVKKIGDDLLLKDGSVDESTENLLAVSKTIEIWLQDAWDAIRSEDGCNEKGRYYTEYIDVKSFARMYLVHEYVKSYDVACGSLFFHRDGLSEDDKLIAGPVWDLDNSMGSTDRGNKSVGDLRTASGAFIPLIDEARCTSVFRNLSRHQDFMEEVARQYEANRELFDDLYVTAEQLISDIRGSALMNHIKVNDLPNYNLHYYFAGTVLDEGTDYEQRMLATTHSKSDWEAYAANLRTYLIVRSRWFSDFDFKECLHSYTSELVTVKASPESDGKIIDKCTRCGESAAERIIYAPSNYELSKTEYTYDGSAKKPEVTITDLQGEIIEASNYNVSYSDNVKAGKASVKISFRGDRYEGSKTLIFTIGKANNPLTVKAKTAKISRAKLMKKARSLSVSKVIKTAKKGQGKTRYRLVSAKKSKKSYKKYFKINAGTGKVTLKKSLKKGTYKIKAGVKAAGNSNYRASAEKKVTFTIKVK